KNKRGSRQELRLANRRNAPNAMLIAVPNSNTHHWVVIPRNEKLEISALAPFIQALCPVATEIVESATGTAKINANQALKPIQKKISHSPWLQDSNQPRNGWSARLTKT